MDNQQHPRFANGKICYIVIPAGNIKISAAFYTNVFGWNTRENNEGEISFDDSAGEVSGTWMTGCDPFTGNSLQMHLMVYDINATMELIKSNGGSIINTPGNADVITAQFADPFGNIFGLYQHN